MTLNFGSSCPHFSSAGIINHYAQFVPRWGRSLGLCARQASPRPMQPHPSPTPFFETAVQARLGQPLLHLRALLCTSADQTWTEPCSPGTENNMCSLSLELGPRLLWARACQNAAAEGELLTMVPASWKLRKRMPPCPLPVSTWNTTGAGAASWPSRAICPNIRRQATNTL